MGSLEGYNDDTGGGVDSLDDNENDEEDDNDEYDDDDDDDDNLEQSGSRSRGNAGEDSKEDAHLQPES